VAVGTVFPLVFAIQAAYSARGSAQNHLSDMKASLMFLYFQMRAYDRKYGLTLANRIRDLVSDLTVSTISTLQTNTPSHACYDIIAMLVDEITDGTADKLPAPLFGGISSLMQTVLRKLEDLRMVRDYETPKGLRKFATFLIFFTPVLLAPYWSSFCADAEGGHVYSLAADGTLVKATAAHDEELEHPFGCIAGYFIAVLYVVITFSLLRCE